jgi:ATP-binding cassette subfamily B protein
MSEAASTVMPRLDGLRGTVVTAGRAVALAATAAPVSLVVLLSAMLAVGLAPATGAELTRDLINGLSAGHGNSLVLVALGIGATGVLTATVPKLVTYLETRLRRGLALRTQDRLYSAILGLDGIAYFERPEFLDRVRLAQQSAASGPDQVVASLLGAGQSAVTAVSYLAVLAAISPVVAAMTAVAAVPTFLVQLSLSRRRAGLAWRISSRNRRQLFYQMLMLDLAAVKEIRLFGLGAFLLGRLNRETRSINAAEERVDRRTFLGQAPLALLGGLILVGALLYVVDQARNGALTLGDVSAFVVAVTGVQVAIAAVVAGAAGTHQTLLLFTHYLHICTMSSDLPVPARPRRLPALSGEVTLHDVWFRYTDDGPWVLRGVTMTIPAGCSVGLVGLNGAGKSTLVKLLCRLYDPTLGQISWDGVDLRDVPVADLRARISAVFQDYVCYDFSVADNIGLGDVDRIADRSAVEHAARLAGADRFIAELPAGYDTLLSRVFISAEDTSGTALSGGQRQRVALARAMMRDRRDLMILDEPSSGLDPDAESETHRRLLETRQGAAALLISHRLATVRGADRIVVLDGGVIAESGTHDELIRVGGMYARLFEKQAAGYRAGVGADG